MKKENEIQSYNFTPKILKKSKELAQNRRFSSRKRKVEDRLFEISKQKNIPKRSTSQMNVKRSRSRISTSKNDNKNNERQSDKKNLSMSFAGRTNVEKPKKKKKVTTRRSKKSLKKVHPNKSISSTIFLQECELQEKSVHEEKKKRRRKSRKASDKFEEMVKKSIQRSNPCKKNNNNTLIAGKYSDSLVFSNVSTPKGSFKVSKMSIQSYIEGKVEEFEFDEFFVGSTQQAPEKKNIHPSRSKSRISQNKKRKKELKFKKIPKNENKKVLQHKDMNPNQFQSIENFKDAYSTMMNKIKKMRQPEEFMNNENEQNNTGNDKGNKFLLVNGVKIYYQDSSLNDIINMNLREKIF